MTYCPQCGYALRDGMPVCPACGVKTALQTAKDEPVKPLTEITDTLATAQENTAETSEVFPIPEPVSEKAPSPVKTRYSDNTPPMGKYAPLSAGGYLINQILFMLPGIGFIIAIIMACASRRINRRRHALSAVILHIIAIAVTAAAIAAVVWIGAENIGFLTKFI